MPVTMYQFGRDVKARRFAKAAASACIREVQVSKRCEVREAHQRPLTRASPSD